VADVVDERLAALVARHGLDPAAARRFRALLEAVAVAPASLTSVRDPALAVDVHVADSLTALDLPELRNADRVCDIGSGAGYPGLPLAIALPHARFALVESATRKCAFLRGVTADLGLSNLEVIHARVEEWRDGAGLQDVVCARALAPMATLVEYSAPLLRPGGCLVAWKGRLGIQESAAASACATAVGLRFDRVAGTTPFPGARDHTLYLYESHSSPPNDLPRRPGMARKRPLGT